MLAHKYQMLLATLLLTFNINANGGKAVKHFIAKVSFFSQIATLSISEVNRHYYAGHKSQAEFRILVYVT